MMKYILLLLLATATIQKDFLQSEIILKNVSTENPTYRLLNKETNTWLSVTDMVWSNKVVEAASGKSPRNEWEFIKMRDNVYKLRNIYANQYLFPSFS